MNREKNNLEELEHLEKRSLYTSNVNNKAREQVEQIMREREDNADILAKYGPHVEKIKNRGKRKLPPVKKVNIKKIGVAFLLGTIITIYGCALYNTSLIKPKVDSFVNDVEKTITNLLERPSEHINSNDFLNSSESEEKSFGK